MATWDDVQISQVTRPQGIYVTIQLTRDPTGEIKMKRFRFDSQAQVTAELAGRIALAKTKAELKYSFLNKSFIALALSLGSFID